MASDALPYSAVVVHMPQGIDDPDDPQSSSYPYELQSRIAFTQQPVSDFSSSDMYISQPPSDPIPSGSQQQPVGANHYPSSSSAVPRLPPILQVEKQQVTTSATQLASASRRRNEAHFVCPVPGCGSTFTRRFNLRGHLRSHTEERPYVCEWPGCQKGFARQHDCKRHRALHAAKSQSNVCGGCKKTFSRLDALNRHLRSEGGAECRQHNPKFAASLTSQTQPVLHAHLQAPPGPLQLPPLTAHQQSEALREPLI